MGKGHIQDLYFEEFQLLLGENKKTLNFEVKDLILKLSKLDLYEKLNF